MSQHSFTKACRLLTAKDYSHVFGKPDIRLGSPCLLILAKPSSTTSRLGLVVAKKQIRLANRRNRVKRLARESFRHQTFKKPVEVVVLVRHGANDMDNKQLLSLLNKQWQRLNKKLAALPDAPSAEV